MEYIILIIASFLAAFVSGAAGFGGALLLLPVVTVYVGAEVAVPVLTIAQLIGNLSRMAFGFKEIKWKFVGLFCVGAIPLSILGAFGFSILPKDMVTRFIGAVLIGMVAIKTVKKIEFKGGTKTLIFGGCFVGLLSGLAGSAGPLGAAIFLSLGLPPVAYIASEASTATVMHIVKTIVYGKLMNISLEAAFTGVLMGAAMIFGTFCANRIIKKMSKDNFQKYVSVLLCIVGVYMIIFGA
ncbi:sulfite exporter TauE/SafE family protein [Lacrimispora sp. 38-1]|uniref:sulfite exporter TauE/SafE family protein n=1 Tax=Lacrimispora sp. 38-1 TaxID=3125778 RepID=UPI003CF6A0BE